jgi:hypothetical protein
MQEEKSVLRERAGIFAIYLVVLFINAFVDLGHKIIIPEYNFYDLWRANTAHINCHSECNDSCSIYPPVYPFGSPFRQVC